MTSPALLLVSGRDVTLSTESPHAFFCGAALGIGAASLPDPAWAPRAPRTHLPDPIQAHKRHRITAGQPGDSASAVLDSCPQARYVVHMAVLHHIYVTAHGEWTTANWLGEKAQIGIRLPITATADEPAKGSEFTPVVNGDVALDSGTQAGTNGTLTRTWTARLGEISSVDNADATMQADLADDMWTYLNTIKGYISAYFRWTHVKIAPMLADGSYGAPSAVYTFTSPLVGTGTAPTLPPEVAIAVSFRAAVIGRRGRGRFYLPAITGGSASDADGVITSACRTALVNATTTLVSNLQDMPGVELYGPTVAVMSAGSSTAVRPSQIRVGNHFDAQRRRQHQVPETYTSGAL